MCDIFSRNSHAKSINISDIFKNAKYNDQNGKNKENCVVLKITALNEDIINKSENVTTGLNGNSGTDGHAEEDRKISVVSDGGRSDENIENEEEESRRPVILVPLPEYEKSEEPLPNDPKTTEVEFTIRSAIEKNDFLNKRLTAELVNKIISAMTMRDVTAGEKIIKERKEGSEMYVSSLGRFKITVKGKTVAEFEDSRVFGELAILYNAKRQASIQALTSAKVWVLTRDVYQKIMLRSYMKEQDEILRSLENNETLNVIGTEGLREVVNVLRQEFFNTGTKIVRQGDQGDKFYIIRAGEVTVSKEAEGVVGTLRKGDCFGELALQNEDCRQATVTANAPGVECLTLTRSEFVKYFGDIRFSEYKPKKQIHLSELREEYGDLKFKELKPISSLGIGGFGRVDLVKSKNKKYKDALFALKCESKINIVKRNRQSYIFNEKEIQMNSRSPFIVRLFRTYRDSRYVYFLMEPCLKGDLFNLLHRQREGKFVEKEAQFFVACVVECFDYLHSRGIIYRDLKTENLMIDKNGYLKLTDFGFAKKIPLRGRTYTFVGTPEYVAPEIFLQKGHDKGADYWALGVFTYELLTGKTPFYRRDRNEMKIFDMALRGIEHVKFPDYLTQKARNLVLRLCRYEVTDRLGMQLGGVDNIRRHGWFSEFDWVHLQDRQMPSPFRNLRDLPRSPLRQAALPQEELSGWDEGF